MHKFVIKGKHFLLTSRDLYRTKRIFKHYAIPITPFSTISFSQTIRNARGFLYRGEWLVSSNWSCQKVRWSPRKKNKKKRKKYEETGRERIGGRNYIFHGNLVPYTYDIYNIRGKVWRKGTVKVKVSITRFSPRWRVRFLPSLKLWLEFWSLIQARISRQSDFALVLFVDL